MRRTRQQKQRDRLARLPLPKFMNAYPGTYRTNGYRNHHWATPFIQAVLNTKLPESKPKTMAAGGAH